jgi:hypothetical protein
MLRIWQSILSESILAFLFGANLCFLIVEILILPAFKQLQVPFLVLNFLLSSAFTALHFHFQSKLRNLYVPNGFEKLTFEQEATNLFYLSASCITGIVLSSVLLRASPILHSFPLALWFLLTSAISLRWTTISWKSRSFNVIKQTFSTLSQPSFEAVLFADVLTSFARPVSSVFPSKTARAVIFRYHHRIDAHM